LSIIVSKHGDKYSNLITLSRFESIITISRYIILSETSTFIVHVIAKNEWVRVH